MSTGAPAPAGPTVGDVALGLRSLWLPVLVFVAVAAGAGYALGSGGEVRYEATTSVLVADARDQVGVFGDQVPGPAVDVESVALLARSDDVRLRAAERLGLAFEDVDDIDVDAEDGERTLVLRAVAPTATDAIDLANAHADALVAERRAQVRAELATILDALETRVAAGDAQLAELRARVADAATGPDEEAPAALQGELDVAASAVEVLRERLVQLEVEAEVAPAGVVVADRAAEAGEVGAPGPSQLAILGALVGLVLAAGLVYLRLSYVLAAEEGRSRLQPRLRGLGDDDRIGRNEAS